VVDVNVAPHGPGPGARRCALPTKGGHSAGHRAAASAPSLNRPSAFMEGSW